MVPIIHVWGYSGPALGRKVSFFVYNKAFQNKLCVLSDLTRSLSSVKMKKRKKSNIVACQGTGVSGKTCFFHCVCFMPRSLVPFGKSLDPKCTIYFEWPNNYCSIDMFIVMRYRWYTFRYVISSDGKEGFIPYVYCAPLGSTVNEDTIKQGSLSTYLTSGDTAGGGRITQERNTENRTNSASSGENNNNSRTMSPGSERRDTNQASRNQSTTAAPPGGHYSNTTHNSPRSPTDGTSYSHNPSHGAATHSQHSPSGGSTSQSNSFVPRPLTYRNPPPYNYHHNRMRNNESAHAAALNLQPTRESGRGSCSELSPRGPPLPSRPEPQIQPSQASGLNTARSSNAPHPNQTTPSHNAPHPNQSAPSNSGLYKTQVIYNSSNASSTSNTSRHAGQGQRSGSARSGGHMFAGVSTHRQQQRALTAHTIHSMDRPDTGGNHQYSSSNDSQNSTRLENSAQNSARQNMSPSSYYGNTTHSNMSNNHGYNHENMSGRHGNKNSSLGHGYTVYNHSSHGNLASNLSNHSNASSEHSNMSGSYGNQGHHKAQTSTKHSNQSHGGHGNQKSSKTEEHRSRFAKFNAKFGSHRYENVSVNMSWNEPRYHSLDRYKGNNLRNNLSNAGYGAGAGVKGHVRHPSLDQLPGSTGFNTSRDWQGSNRDLVSGHTRHPSLDRYTGNTRHPSLDRFTGSERQFSVDSQSGYSRQLSVDTQARQTGMSRQPSADRQSGRTRELSVDRMPRHTRPQSLERQTGPARQPSLDRQSGHTRQASVDRQPNYTRQPSLDRQSGFTRQPSGERFTSQDRVSRKDQFQMSRGIPNHDRKSSLDRNANQSSFSNKQYKPQSTRGRSTSRDRGFPSSRGYPGNPPSSRGYPRHPGGAPSHPSQELDSVGSCGDQDRSSNSSNTPLLDLSEPSTFSKVNQGRYIVLYKFTNQV